MGSDFIDVNHLPCRLVLRLEFLLQVASVASSTNPIRKRADRVPSHSPDPAAPGLGELKVLGKYHLLRLLGKGGMGEVHLGFDPLSHQSVAVKLLDPQLETMPSFVNRFIREGEMSRKLSHPNLVKGLQAGCDKESGRHYLILEYVEGPTAQQRLEQEGRLPVAEALRITLEIARALEFLHHQAFVHRDIKPSNILLAPNGIAKLADLGVAKDLRGATELTTLDQGIGTPYYMPWEQTLNASVVDQRSDIFSLGATLYHLITGMVPFPGENDRVIARRKEIGNYRLVTDIDPELPRELDGILNQMLAKDPRRRFRTVRELIEVLTASGLKDGDLRIAKVDLDLGMDDTPTRLDVEKASQTPLEEDAVWLLCFRTRGGTARRTKGRTNDVMKWIDRGLLPRSTVAARKSSPRFRRLRDYPEFRTLFEKVSEKVAEASRRGRVRASRMERLSSQSSVSFRQLGVVCVTGLLSVLLSAAALYFLLFKQG